MKITAPQKFDLDVVWFCRRRFLLRGPKYEPRSRIVEAAIHESYKKCGGCAFFHLKKIYIFFFETFPSPPPRSIIISVFPWLSRRVRSHLTRQAEKASVDSFCRNLRGVLLEPPLTGRSVMGIDPGFANGCKAACVGDAGQLLSARVLRPAFGGGRADDVLGPEDRRWMADQVCLGVCVCASVRRTGEVRLPQPTSLAWI